MFYGEIPNFVEGDDYDEEVSQLIAEVAQRGCLKAVGFNKEPGSVEDFRPIRAPLKPKSRHKAKQEKPPKWPTQSAQRHQLLTRQAREQEAAKRLAAEQTIERSRLSAQRLAWQREIAAAETAKQEVVGMQWAKVQLQNIVQQIEVFRLQGDLYRAREMQNAAMRVLYAYPMLPDLHVIARQLGLY